MQMMILGLMKLRLFFEDAKNFDPVSGTDKGEGV